MSEPHFDFERSAFDDARRNAAMVNDHHAPSCEMSRNIFADAARGAGDPGDLAAV